MDLTFLDQFKDLPNFIKIGIIVGSFIIFVFGLYVFYPKKDDK